jgi:hypothetical protein
LLGDAFLYRPITLGQNTRCKNSNWQAAINAIDPRICSYSPAINSASTSDAIYSSSAPTGPSKVSLPATVDVPMSN